MVTGPQVIFKTISLAVSSQRFTFTPSVSFHWTTGDIFCINLVVSCQRFTLTPSGDILYSISLVVIAVADSPWHLQVVFTGLQALFKTISLVVSSQRFTFTHSVSCHWAPGDILLHQYGSQLSQIHLLTCSSSYWAPVTFYYEFGCPLSQIHLNTCSSG